MDMTNKQQLFDKLFAELPNDAWVHHGMKNHAMNKRYDCLDCINTELWFFELIKKAGGLKKLIAAEKKKISK